MNIHTTECSVYEGRYKVREFQNAGSNVTTLCLSVIHLIDLAIRPFFLSTEQNVKKNHSPTSWKK